MKLTLSLALLCLSALDAFAGGGYISSSGGSGDCTGNCTFTSVTTNGTAPSLTATGAEFGSSITVRATAGQNATLFSTAVDDFQSVWCNRTRSATCALKAAILINNSGVVSLSNEGETIFAHAYPNTYFNSSGLLFGIGTASPLAKLSVVGDSSFSLPSTFGSSVTVRGASGATSLNVSNPADDAQISMCNRTHSSTCTNQTQFSISNGGSLSLTSNGDTVFVHSYPNTYFNSSGLKFGIGTASPASKLDVVGDAQFGSGVSKSTFSATGSLTLASAATLTINGGTGGGGIRLSSGATTANTISGWLSTSTVVDLGALAGATCTDSSNITLNGADDGDVTAVGVPAALSGLAGVSVTARATAANTVVVRACCTTVGACSADAPVVNVKIYAWKNPLAP